MFYLKNGILFLREGVFYHIIESGQRMPFKNGNLQDWHNQLYLLRVAHNSNN